MAASQESMKQLAMATDFEAVRVFEVFANA